MSLQEKLQTISLSDKYRGSIDAYYAWTHGCKIAKRDDRRLRRELAKFGYTCSIKKGIIVEITKLEENDDTN